MLYNQFFLYLILIASQYNWYTFIAKKMSLKMQLQWKGVKRLMQLSWETSNPDRKTGLWLLQNCSSNRGRALTTMECRTNFHEFRDDGKTTMVFLCHPLTSIVWWNSTHLDVVLASIKWSVSRTSIHGISVCRNIILRVWWRNIYETMRWRNSIQR